MWRVSILSVAAAAFSACSAPIAPVLPPSGEEIAFGGGPGGPSDACFTCHGLKGEGRESVPRLAGQSAGYLLKQMEDYAGGWRQHTEMSAISGRLSDGGRTQAALYYAGLSNSGVRSPASQAPTIFLSGDSTRGLQPCSECHGSDGRGAGFANPSIAGQPEQYVVQQLQAWKASKRRNDPQNVMGAVARKLTATEIEILAAYVASLP